MSRSQGSNKGQNGHIHVLSFPGPYLVHLCLDFKILLHGLLPLRRRKAI